MNPTEFPLTRSGEVNLALLGHLVHWTQPSAVEKLMFIVGEIDHDQLLKEVGACPSLAKLRWGAGDTLLDAAVGENRNDLAALLIEHGADVNAYQEGAGLPLHSAIECGNLEGVRLLIANGSRIDIPNRRGETPLHSAAIYGDPAIVQFLLDSKARMGARSYKHLTPLETAIKWNRMDVVVLLVKQGATTRDPEFQSYIDDVMKP